MELTTKSYDALVLGGGREKGMAIIAILEEYHKKGTLNNIKIYGGTSVGSIICLLLSIGCTPEEIFKLGIEKNIYDAIKYDGNLNFMENVSNIVGEIFTNFGIADIESLTTEIEVIVKNKFGYIPTLGELYKLTGKKLCFSTLNITRKKCVYIENDTFPNLSCIKAVQMSSRIPALYTKCEYKNMQYIDGVFANPFVIDKIDDGKMNILGIIVHGDIPKIGNPLADHYIDIFNSILRIPTSRCYEKCGKNCDIIKIELEDSFVVDGDKKMHFYLEGQKHLKSLFNKSIKTLFHDEFSLKEK